MRKLAVATLVVGMVTAILVAGGCTAKSAPIPSSPQSPLKTLDIGMATPLSGPQALAGTQMQNAVLLAVSDQNQQGGVNIAGQKYTLNAVVRDTKFNVIVSKSVAEELVFEKGVKVIAGPFIADTV